MKYIVLYKQNEMLYSYTHIFSSRCISSHTQFPSSSNFKELGKEIGWSWSYLQLRPPSAQWDCWWWNHPRTSQPLGSPSYERKFIVIYNATWYRSIYKIINTTYFSCVRKRDILYVFEWDSLVTTPLPNKKLENKL